MEAPLLSLGVQGEARRRFRIWTNWTNSVSKTLEFELNDLVDGTVRDKFKWQCPTRSVCGRARLGRR